MNGMEIASLELETIEFPKVMLTFPNGSRIPVTEKALHKGLLDLILLVFRFVNKTHLLFLMIDVL